MACPAGLTSQAGSLSASACKCPAGWSLVNGVCTGVSIGGPLDSRNAGTSAALICPRNYAPVNGSCSLCPAFTGTSSKGAQTCAPRHYQMVRLSGLQAPFNGLWTITRNFAPGSYPIYNKGPFYLQMWPAQKAWYITDCAVYSTSCAYFASFAGTLGKPLQQIGSGSYAICDPDAPAYDYAGRRVCYCSGGLTSDSATNGYICVPCAKGSYHADATQDDTCVACAGANTTVFAGANSSSACISASSIAAPLTSCSGGKLSVYDASGSVSCRCPPATTDVSGACTDVNECAASNACQYGCANSYASFSCYCPAGQALASNGLNCTSCPASMYGNGTACLACPAHQVASADGASCACAYTQTPGGDCLPPSSVSVAISSSLSLTLRLVRMQYPLWAGASGSSAALSPRLVDPSGSRTASPIYYATTSAVGGTDAYLYWALGGAWAATNAKAGAYWALDRNPALVTVANGSAATATTQRRRANGVICRHFVCVACAAPHCGALCLVCVPTISF